MEEGKVMKATKDDEKQNVAVSAVYERPDTDAGFITDASEIMQLKAIRKSDIINSELLGEFDENGVYNIDKNLIIQLVRLPKRITHKNEFGIFAEATVDEKTYHFRMTPTKAKDGKLISQVELLEEIYHANGYIIDTRTTLLATYMLEPVSNFDQIAMRKFHFSTHPDDDDFGGDLGDGNGVLLPQDADYIKHRQAYLKAMGLVSLGLYERLEEAYFKKRMKILNNIPEAAIVLAEYKKQFSKVEHYFVNNSKRKYRAMNEILTAVIEGGKGDSLRRNPAYREQMREANRIYLNTVNQIDNSVQQSMQVINAVAKSMPIDENHEIKQSPEFIVSNTKKEQKKNETNSFDKKSNKPSLSKNSGSKSSGGKSSGGKSGGGGGAKKDDKKPSAGGGASSKVPTQVSTPTPSPTEPSADSSKNRMGDWSFSEMEIENEADSDRRL